MSHPAEMLSVHNRERTDRRVWSLTGMTALGVGGIAITNGIVSTTTLKDTSRKPDFVTSLAAISIISGTALIAYTIYSRLKSRSRVQKLGQGADRLPAEDTACPTSNVPEMIGT